MRVKNACFLLDYDMGGGGEGEGWLPHMGPPTLEAFWLSGKVQVGKTQAQIAALRYSMIIIAGILHINNWEMAERPQPPPHVMLVAAHVQAQGTCWDHAKKQT